MFISAQKKIIAWRLNIPLYDYSCQQCGIIEDEFQHINDDAFIECPRCGSETIKRLLLGQKLQFINDVIDPYYDPHLESMIHSNSQRRELMKQKGFKEGRGDTDKKIVEGKKEWADKLKISVPQLEAKLAKQRAEVYRPNY